jgi:hypothetical protein
MSLLICSSGQEKYTTTGFQTLDNNEVLTSTAQAAGIQNPASFTNNINPVVKIPPNSEVALKSASYFKNKMFQIGSNTSFAFYFGQYLRSRFGLTAKLSLSETTNFPIPIPIPKGTYNMRTFANALSEALDTYMSHPDLLGHSWVEPAALQGDGVHTDGLIFNFQQGDTGTLVDATTEFQTLSVVNPWKTTTNEFTWTEGTLRYTGTANADEDNNYGILETAPITQKGGTMTWNVSNAASGWRIGLTRPTARDGREEPHLFNDGSGVDIPPFFDYVLDYDGETYTLYHCVEEAGALVMKEIEYYSNNSASFEPALDDVSYGIQYSAMHDGGLWTDTKASAAGSAGSIPDRVDFIVSGEDITIQYQDNHGNLFTLTDTRLCVDSNTGTEAKTPERNKFPKPTGLTTHALYAKVNVKAGTEYLTLTQYDAATKSGSVFVEASAAEGLLYEYPQIASASADGKKSAGSSFYGRSVLSGQMKTREIAQLVDRAEPYQSGLTTTQKQYVGLGGPDGATPPVRVGEGDPYIPDPAVEDGLGIAYTIGLVLVPSTSGVGANTIKGSYATETSDVSALFGFPDSTMVASTRGTGYTYLLANEPTETDTAPPTHTDGAFFGWYVGSDTAPTFSRGQMFLRVPQFTHTSQNFGKGIPSKIIASLPPATDDGTSGEIFYEPSNMTYVALNNPTELNINVLTLEIVDKQDQLIEGLSKSSTFVLHVRQKDK